MSTAIDVPDFLTATDEGLAFDLFEYQLKFLEHNINPPIVFRIDGKNAFDPILRLSKILQDMEMEYFTVLVQNTQSSNDHDDNEFRALELPIFSDRLTPQRRNIKTSSEKDSIQLSFAGIEYATSYSSRIFWIHLDEFENAYYCIGRMKAPKKVGDIELSNHMARYYHDIERLNTFVMVNPQVSFCKLIEIVDMIKLVEQNIRNSLIDDPSADLSELDFFRRLRIQQTTDWDEYVLSKIRENPELAEELEDAL